VAQVQVVPVDASNVHDVLDLAVSDEQLRWVRPTAWYVARSAYDPTWTPVALLDGDEVVGFAEWAVDPDDGSGCMGGLVVDQGRQGRGYGRAAVEALADLLLERPDCTWLALTVHEDNAVARGLYARLGFTETGEVDNDGELVMVRR
jgi:diamine N-acetyltransferase